MLTLMSPPLGLGKRCPSKVAYKVDHPFLCSGLETSCGEARARGGSWAGEAEERTKERSRKPHARMRPRNEARDGWQCYPRWGVYVLFCVSSHEGVTRKEGVSRGGTVVAYGMARVGKAACSKTAIRA